MQSDPISLPRVINPCLPYQYKENFIENELHQKVLKYVSTDIPNYHKLNGRSVISFGVPYPYPGAPATLPEEISPIFQEVIDLIESKHPGSNINSCIVTKYSGVSSGIPEHSDNERMIRPDSNIYCVSLGQSRTITFRDKLSASDNVKNNG